MDKVPWICLFGMVTIITLRWLFTWSLSPRNQQTIRYLFLQRLLTLFPEATIVTEDEEHISARLGGACCHIRLEALYRRCREFPFHAERYIQEVVQSLRQALQDTVGLPADWQQCILALWLRLDAQPPAEIIRRNIVGTLAVGYVLKMGEGFRWITQQDLDISGVSEDELHHFALRNIERSFNMLVIETSSPVSEGDDRVVSFNTRDGLDASRLLLPSFYQRFSSRFGEEDLLVGIPTRDTLIMVGALDQAHAHLLAWRAGVDLFLLRVSAAGDAGARHQQRVGVMVGGVSDLSPGMAKKLFAKRFFVAIAVVFDSVFHRFFHLLKDIFRFILHILMAFFGQFTQQVALASGQVGGHRHGDHHMQVAVMRAVQLGHALPAHAEDLAGLCAGGDGQLFFAVQRGHHELAAQRRGGEGHRDFADEVQAAPFKAAMRLDMDDHHQVAGFRAAQAGITLAAVANARAGVDAGGDVHLQFLRHAHPTLPAAGAARIGDHLPGAATALAGDHARRIACRESCVLVCRRCPVPWQARQGMAPPLSDPAP